MDCLGLIEGLFVPHCDEVGRQESTKELLKKKDIISIQLSNCCAIEIIDHKYRILTEDASRYGIKAYAMKTYWENNEYIQEEIAVTSEFQPLKDLLSKNTIKLK